MTGKIVNLKRERKAKTRTAAKGEADANAARHGRTKAERAASADDAHRAARHVDGHKVERE